MEQFLYDYALELWLYYGGIFVIVAAIVLSINYIVYGRRLRPLDPPQPSKSSMNFKNRCPMCGNSPLEAGVMATFFGNRFISDKAKGLNRLKGLNNPKRALRCPQCGLTLMFDPPSRE